MKRIDDIFHCVYFCFCFFIIADGKQRACSAPNQHLKYRPSKETSPKNANDSVSSLQSYSLQIANKVFLVSLLSVLIQLEGCVLAFVYLLLNASSILYSRCVCVSNCTHMEWHKLFPTEQSEYEISLFIL